MIIKSGEVVKVDYVLTDLDYKILDSSEISNGGAVKIQVGIGQVIVGFDKALIDMQEGEEKEVILSPEEAFGSFDPILLEKVPREQFPKAKEIPEGKLIEYVGPSGSSSPAWIRLVEDDYVIIDMNHPLAGKTVKLAIKVIETGLTPDPVQNPFMMGMGCNGSCDHDH